METFEKAMNDRAYDPEYDEYDMFHQERPYNTTIDKAAVLNNWIEADVIEHETKRQALEISMMEDKVAIKYPVYQITNRKANQSEMQLNTTGTFRTALDSAQNVPIKLYLDPKTHQPLVWSLSSDRKGAPKLSKRARQHDIDRNISLNEPDQSMGNLRMTNSVHP